MATLNLNKAEFLKSAVSPSGFLAADLPCIVFAGKSNVGKSSVINKLLLRKNFARVGEAPGKTTHINYFLIDEKMYLIDLPGYGYAKVSKSVTENWGAMMEEYFENRQGLKKVVQLVDIRHAPSAQDQQMYEYLRHYGMDGRGNQGRQGIAQRAAKMYENHPSDVEAWTGGSCDSGVSTQKERL